MSSRTKDSSLAGMGVAPSRARPFPARFVVAASVVLLAFVYLVATGLELGTAYYVTVGELRGGQPTAKAARVSGDVVPGSIVRDGELVRFEIADATGSLPVAYRGVVPDIFGENIQVVVEGNTRNDGTFEATTLLAKCPSRFEADTPQLAGGSR